LQLNDAEAAPQAVPAPAPTTAPGGTNNDDDKNVASEPPAAGVEQPPMEVDHDVVNETTTPDQSRSTNSFIRQTYERFIQNLDPQDPQNPETASDAGYRILATFRGDNHVGKAYDQKVMHNTIALQSVARFSAPGDRIHPHDLAPETWRRYATGEIYTGANFPDTVRHINKEFDNFYEGKNPLQRVHSLKFTVQPETILDGFIGSDHKVNLGAPLSNLRSRPKPYLTVLLAATTRSTWAPPTAPRPTRAPYPSATTPS